MLKATCSVAVGAAAAAVLGRKTGPRIGTAVDTDALADDAPHRAHPVDFARKNGQLVRGHTLVRHSRLPAWTDNGGFTAEELREILHRHIAADVLDENNTAEPAYGTQRQTLTLAAGRH
ncbi:endo-1,4-beta-xylanase [Streptomyces sp. NBC_00683]|uniref:endo-1,4-beta-xylanase n=1 Tax=Streptomyces sp. NBC_00683 TaxID=2903670 RepID=UPI002E37B9AC|nr:endo-1,4-beta-xylanase [Streptomyces sp. NBC_00683]